MLTIKRNYYKVNKCHLVTLIWETEYDKYSTKLAMPFPSLLRHTIDEFLEEVRRS
jgi:hypothetical protein